MNNLLTEQICVTGTIGCGKSRVARFLAAHCHLPYIDVDEIAREIMEPGRPGVQALKRYNPKFLCADGSLNRSLLRREIFNCQEVKAAVDALLHPLIQTALMKQVQGLHSKAVIEIPLLYETGWDSLFKTIIVVYARKETCLERIMVRDQVTLEDAEKAYGQQMDMELKKNRTLFVIDNDGEWSVTVKNIEKVASRLAIM